MGIVKLTEDIIKASKNRIKSKAGKAIEENLKKENTLENFLKTDKEAGITGPNQRKKTESELKAIKEKNKAEVEDYYEKYGAEDPYANISEEELTNFNKKPVKNASGGRPIGVGIAKRGYGAVMRKSVGGGLRGVGVAQKGFGAVKKAGKE